METAGARTASPNCLDTGGSLSSHSALFSPCGLSQPHGQFARTSFDGLSQSSGCANSVRAGCVQPFGLESQAFRWHGRCGQAVPTVR